MSLEIKRISLLALGCIVIDSAKWVCCFTTASSCMFSQSDFLTCCRDLEHTPQLWATHASGSNALKDFCSEAVVLWWHDFLDYVSPSRL